MDKEEEMKCQEICEIGMEVWQRGYVTANDGNISVWLSDNTVLCTPTGISRGALILEMMYKVRSGGSVINEDPPYKTSSEVRVHLQLYREDSRVNAVVHACPIYATAFAIGGEELVNKQIPEDVLATPAIPVAPYAAPSITQPAESITPLVREHTECLMEMHGALSWDGPLLVAYQSMGRLRYMAQLTYLYEQLGFKSRQLPEDEIQELISMCPQYRL